MSRARTGQGEKSAGCDEAAPQRRRRLFIAISMLLPVLLLVFGEVVLRLAGYGGFPPTVRELGTEDGKALVITDTTGAASYFDERRTKPGSLNQHAFLSPKSAGTIRVVLAGGSAIKGFPQPMGLANSAFLQAMLAEVWPDKTVEVINLGTTAVASFPVLGMLTEVLPYEPDVVVVYSGHNEFFGAYGVASRHFGGRSPAALVLHRWFGGTAIGGALRNWGADEGAGAGITLMEGVVAESEVRPHDSLRAAAARNLEAHVGQMVMRCQAQGIPVVVCTVASNEGGLAPIGQSAPSSLSEEQLAARQTALAAAEEGVGGVTERIEQLRAVVAFAPDDARIHFELARALEVAGSFEEARSHFAQAIDLDPMPWRAPSTSNEAIRRAATQHQAVLCEVPAAFRRESPNGIVGWGLFDDHVHPSLEGQCLLARAIVEAFGALDGEVHVSREAYESLPAFEVLAKRLGANKYDRYTVVEHLCRVFDVPFMRSSNAAARDYVQGLKGQMLAAMGLVERAEAGRWSEPTTHHRIRVPLSGMVGRAIIRQQRLTEAAGLLAAARNHVPRYSGYHFEYTFFMLACRQQSDGVLTEADRRLARATIADIGVYLKYTEQSSGQPQRYLGRLHQLLDEYEEAIPHLEQARRLVQNDDLLAVDMAVIESYVKTGKRNEALRVLNDGIARGGKHAAAYRQVLQALSQP